MAITHCLNCGAALPEGSRKSRKTCSTSCRTALFHRLKRMNISIDQYILIKSKQKESNGNDNND
jgi:predicted nucleic acid-binding Zn ribbon protein